MNQNIPQYLRPKLWVRRQLVLLCLLLATPPLALAQKISLNFSKTPLEQVLMEIRKQSGYDIFFDQTLIAQQPPVTVATADASVEQALGLALRGLPLDYELKGKAISIKRMAKSETASAQQRGINVTAVILDENREPRAGATVSSGTLKPVYTDAQGRFTLKGLAPLAKVKIAYTGYGTLEYTALAISLMGKLHLEPRSNSLDETIILGQKPSEATRKVDLTHRRHVNLEQALEGTIPGLVIKNTKTSTTKMMVTPLVTGPGTALGQQYELDFFLDSQRKYYTGLGHEISEVERRVNLIKDGLLNNNSGFGILTTETSYSESGSIPELRGAGGFGANNSGMLIIIDGFVQDSFPADYPMNNVLSLEVIRDPAQTVKWGPRAANGVIIITTNGGKAQSLQVSYNSSFNFSAAPDNSRSALQLANTPQLLDFYQETYAKATLPSSQESNVFKNGGLAPAEVLLRQRYYEEISEQQFQESWNALAQLNNEGQYRQQQQRPFSQTQNLNLTGGGKLHRFSANGSYSTSNTQALGNQNRRLGLNVREQLSLLQNKLQVGLQLNAQFGKQTAGRVLQPIELDPYQLLYNPDGSYGYDYAVKIYPEALNLQLKQQYPGMQDYGYNPLQEARGTTNSRNSRNLQGALNLTWKLLPGFTWSAALQYNHTKTDNETLRTADTYEVRSRYNENYAVKILPPGTFVIKNLNPPVAFLPLGDRFEASQNRSRSANLRSGLGYSQVFDQKHALDAALGLAYYDQLDRSSSQLPLYGYNSQTQTGIPLNLPSNLTDRYDNVLGSPIYFERLLNVQPNNLRPQRNLSANASLSYSYDQRLGLQAFYNETFMPVASNNVYSSTRQYNAMASWQLHRESFFRFPAISMLKLSAGLGEIRMASLPVNLPATRSYQTDWADNALLVTSFNPVRQNGEVVRNYDGLLELGLFEEVLQGQLNYRHNNLGTEHQWSGRLSYHFSKARYFKVPAISNLLLEGFITSISPAQALGQMMGTNTPQTGGGFSMATANFDMGSLPPQTTNKEVRLLLGLFKERLVLDARYYQRITEGINNGTYQTDVSSGFTARSQYSEMRNRGYEFYLQGRILQGKGFTWTSTANLAYNVNETQAIEDPRFILNTGYLSANRAGYATGSLWSFRWAGLDANGNPQVLDPRGNRVAVPATLATGASDPLLQADQSWLEYSGTTTAPWTGALIQELGYRGLYARATLRFALGHVMRTYRPNTSFFGSENSALIAQRWRKPGDEAITDIPKLDAYSSSRVLVAQNSSNSIVSAGFFRLADVQLGYDLPKSWLRGRHLKGLMLTLNLQNIALWTQNDLGIDPEALGSNGLLQTSQPMRYSISLAANL